LADVVSPTPNCNRPGLRRGRRLSCRSLSWNLKRFPAMPLNHRKVRLSQVLESRVIL
jgi:hypothetical protein